MHEPGCPEGIQTPPGRGTAPWLRSCGVKFPQAGVTSLHGCCFTGNLPQHLPSCSNLKGLNLSRIMCTLVVLLWLESHPHGKLRDYDFLMGHKEALNPSGWIFLEAVMK